MKPEKNLLKSNKGDNGSVPAEINTLLNEKADQQQKLSEPELVNEKLLESEMRNRSLFKNLHSAILVIDPEDGSIQDANTAALNFYGWPLKEFKKMKISEINVLSPDEVHQETEKTKLAKGDVILTKHKLSDGTVRDVEIYSSTIEIESQSLLYFIVHDITERINTEQELLKFKLGIERSSNIVFITDKDGYFQYINPTFEKVYGYTFEEIADKTPRILKSGSQDKEFYQTYWQTILSGDEIEVEVLNKTKGGELLNIHFSSNPIIDKNGQHLGFIAIQNDITERKKMDFQVRQSLKEKEVLLAEIHHRVKNNLAIICGLLELELFQSDGKTTTDFIRSSQLRIKSMAKIHEMLYQSESFSHICVKKYIEDLISMIKSTILTDGFEPQFETNIDDINLNINQAIPCGLILNELIYNSLKHAFTDRDEGKVKISFTNQQDKVNLTVNDDGIGVPDDFNFQETQTLGVTLVKILSKQLNADVRIGNSDNGFTCSLTFKKKEDAIGSASNFI